MAPLLAMTIRIRFIRPNKADNRRVQDGETIRSLHVNVMHRFACPILLLIIIDAVHEVLTSKPPHSMGLLIVITVPRKTIAETDHLDSSVGLSTTVYMFHHFDAYTLY